MSDGMIVTSVCHPNQVTIEGYQNPVFVVGGHGKPASLNDAEANENDGSSKARKCSVRGCSRMVLLNSDNKMCDSCRSRHRIYATTKRAKRKKEKAALSQRIGEVSTAAGNQATNNFLATSPPTNQSSSTGVITSNNSSFTQCCTGRNSTKPIVSDNTTLPVCLETSFDPFLFTSQSSELAGALTAPTVNNNEAAGVFEGGEKSIAVETIPTPVSHTLHDSVICLPFRTSQPTSSPDIAPTAPLSLEHPDRVASTSTACRFCSVKGCRVLVPPTSFFKMCELCRNRYRGYGTTKRAKWKHNRKTHSANLETLRELEDKRRAGAGLPLLSDASLEEQRAWECSISEGYLQTVERDPPATIRLCTVSHCREILPGYNKYRRCEQHRLQNRYHSTLKRVREKESKAQGPPDDFRSQILPKKDSEGIHELDSVDGTAVERDHSSQVANESTQDFSREDAARIFSATRSTPLVCSIKSCSNLTDPHLPWKLCDACRARDRLARRNKRLRDSGKLPATSNSLGTTQEENPIQADTEFASPNVGNNTTDPSTENYISGTTDLADCSAPSSPKQLTEAVTDNVLPDKAETNNSTSDATPLPCMLQQSSLPHPKQSSTSVPTIAEPNSEMTFINLTSFHQPRTRRKGINKVKETPSESTTITTKQAASGSANRSSSRPIPGSSTPPVIKHSPSQYSVPYYVTAQSTQVLYSSGFQPHHPPQAYGHHLPYVHPYMQSSYSYIPQPYTLPSYGMPHSHLPPCIPSGYPPLPYGHYPTYYWLTPQKETPSPSTVDAISIPPAEDIPGTSVASGSIIRSLRPATENTETTEGGEHVTQDDCSGQAARRCGYTTCQRVMAVNLTARFCGRCRARMKKHQAKTKQRLKLEPRTSLQKRCLGSGET